MTPWLRRVVGTFAYYARWIEGFAAKVRPLANSLTRNALKTFISLKSELGHVALNTSDTTGPFVVECNASDVAVSVTLN